MGGEGEMSSMRVRREEGEEECNVRSVIVSYVWHAE